MKRMSFAALLLVAATLLGATVLREPVANAAAATLNVFVTNDSSHPVPVHEQGTASVEGTVSARPAAPASPWRRIGIPGAEDPFTVIGPSDSPINLTSLTVSNYFASSHSQVTSVTLREMFVPEDATDCDPRIGSGQVPIWSADRVSAPLSVAFPTPIQVSPRAGTKACITAGVSTNDAAVLSASGFFGN